ncbi:MAG TPA: GNAT family N-acetyltransferase [Rhizomicrobium sp.]|jgi:ribosomal-protein-alanine N-acetyltransferase|nr:GNAT family N-acetyltransferase [Rhizomicrobium sp.]
MSVGLFSPDGDLVPLVAIHAACFADGWNASAIADLLAMPGAFAFAAGDGFIMARAAGGEAEILTLAVTPPARRHGLATALVAGAASHAHLLGAASLFLEVAAGNAAACALYRRLGFAPVGRRKAYYAAGGAIPEDALVLRSNLPLSPLGKSPPAG